MIIREVLQIENSTIYRNYSDKGMYIRNKTDGTLWIEVNSLIDYEYEETDIPIEVEEVQDATNQEQVEESI